MVVTNDKNELIPTRTAIGWRMCMDYRKLNKVARREHFPLPFLDQMLDRLDARAFYYFLDGYSGYNQILIALEDQEKTTFTCTYSTFAFKQMPFVDKAKIEVISKLPPPSSVKGVWSFLGHARFYQRFIKDFSKVVNPLCKLLEKDAKFNFDDDCMRAFELFKFKLTTIPIITAPNWSVPFELMCDICMKGMFRRCVPEEEQGKIFGGCHSSLYGGHHDGARTAAKVLSCGFYWPTLYKDYSELVKRCDECQWASGILKKNEMPLTTILEIDIFDVWGIHFMGTVVSSCRNTYILVAVDYVSKWVEVVDLPNNEALKKLNFDWDVAANLRVAHLNELDEFRYHTYGSSSLYKEKMKCLHDKYIWNKEFKIMVRYRGTSDTSKGRGEPSRG
ncbi:uncharacterized protein [Nicotiana tomentosiformis]|uniref:uncharacterized protein n=1 Tax=Nicotiana tomentosiformis TaxID=4098 RepID=UPI00388CD735